MPPAPVIHLPSSSSPSSTDSFVTASGTAAATPIDAANPDHHADPTAPSPPTYHKPRPMHQDLREYGEIYLEENVVHYTLALLNGLVTPKSPASPIVCPPPNQLSVLASFLVHPDFTTRPPEPSWHEASTESLAYLRDLLHLVGPVNARFHRAFRFASASKRTRTRSVSPASDPDHPSLNKARRDQDDDGSPLSGKYAQDSVWQRGQDFFNVVGWAFNCSVCHPNRWHYWKQWLAFMLDVLEADLHERLRLDQDAGANSRNLLQDSLLAAYINQRASRPAGGLKFILKAIFADGSRSSNSQFQEIWNREHKIPSRTTINKRKREAFNLEKGNFGGFLDDESVYSSQASEPPTPQKKRTLPGGDAKQSIQGLESTYFKSVSLRQKLFSLISFLCFHLPKPPFSIMQLYDDFQQAVRTAPLPIFAAMIDSTTSQLRPDSQISLLQETLSIMIPSNALSPAKVDRASYDSGAITAPILERCFIPYPANTIVAEDNAKVSLLVENLMHIILRTAAVGTFSRDIREAVRKGNTARAEKIKKKKQAAAGRGARPGTDDLEADAKLVLELSAKRLLVLADLVSADADDPMDVQEEDDPDATFMTAHSSDDDRREPVEGGAIVVALSSDESGEDMPNYDNVRKGSAALFRGSRGRGRGGGRGRGRGRKT